MAAIRMKDVGVSFDSSRALERITFTVDDGAWLYITGPSGAGKTTLMRLIHGAIEPDEGEATVLGHDLFTLSRKEMIRLRREVGFVSQDSALIDRKSARDNVALALEVAGVSRRKAKIRADETLHRVRMDRHADVPAHALSAGEKQRVALARALVVAPRIVIADEPTGNLDPALTEEIFRLFDSVHADGATVIIATHDIRRIEISGKPVLSLNEGRISDVRGTHA